MLFSIRHRRRNQVPRIDDPEMVARQCGDFWTAVYPQPVRSGEVNPCKFRLLAGNRGLRVAANPNAGSAVIQPCELIVTEDGAQRIDDERCRATCGRGRRRSQLHTGLRDRLFFLIAVSLHGGTLVLSWIAVLAVQRIPFGAQLIGAPRRAVAIS